MSIAPPERETPADLRHAQRAVLRRLDTVRRRLRGYLWLEGIFWTLTTILLAGALSLLVDRVFRLSLPTRLGLLAIGVIVILVVAVRQWIRPLLLPLDNLDLAELLDRRSPGVGQQISNVLQLPDLLESEDLASPSMVQAAVTECASKLDRVDLTATFNADRRRRLLAGIAAGLLAAVVFCAVWPATAGLWARRWLAGSNVRWPQHTYLSVVGLNDDNRLLIPRGETSLLQIDARPKFVEHEGQWQLSGRGEPLIVEGAETPQSLPPQVVSLNYHSPSGSTRRGNATQFGEASFRYEFPPLAEPIELNITGDDDWLGPITIEPIDRPAVTTLEISASRPGSSEVQKQQIGEGSAQLLFLPETQLQLRLVANQPLASAEVQSKGLPIEGWQRVDERTYTLAWTMKESLALEFRLVGQRGELESKPYFLTIGLLRDREPRVTIRSTGVGRRISPVARVPLTVRATDDFGVASLALDLEQTQIRDDKPEVATRHLALDEEAPAPVQTDREQPYELALREKGYEPGMLLKVRAAATDNCALGAQAGNSRWVAFQVVSADELFYEILMRQREQRAKFSAALESAKAQAKALVELSKPEEAVGLGRTQQVINRQVFQVAGQLDASLQEMTLNDLGNPQARDILQSAIIAPLRKLHTDLLSRLRTSLDGLAQGGAVSQDRRAEAQDLADQSVAVMQAILNQMSQWESFVDVINQLKQVIERQNQVLKATEEIEKKRTDDLFDK